MFSLIAIGLALVFVVGFVGFFVYLKLTSHLDARQEQRRLEQVWGRENDQPPPWDQPITFDDSGPQWRKDQFETLMGRLTLVKTNGHDDYLLRREYLRDGETGQLWLLTIEEPNMSQFSRLTPVDTVPEDV